VHPATGWSPRDVFATRPSAPGRPKARSTRRAGARSARSVGPVVRRDGETGHVQTQGESTDGDEPRPAQEADRQAHASAQEAADPEQAEDEEDGPRRVRPLTEELRRDLHA